MSKYYVHDHQGKFKAYHDALWEANHRPYHNYNSTKTHFMFMDIDVLSRSGTINQFVNRHGKRPVFLYPHTARPVIQWDGMYEPNPNVTAIFTIAQGGVDVPKLYGFWNKPIVPVGWTYCELKPFKGCKNPKKVLYAPEHVNGNGYMNARDRMNNTIVYHRLLLLVKAGKIELTVRYMHKLEWNGLWPEDGVQYVKGNPNQSHVEIDQADVVVSKQNMQYISVARGKPTLGIAEDAPIISGSSEHNTMEVSNWHLYKDVLKYPLDILEHEDTMGLIEQACEENDEVSAWRERFIGEPFNKELFIETVSEYV